MKITKAEIKELATKAVQSNPYIRAATKYFLGKEVRYLYLDKKSYTKDELDELYFATASKDIERGFNERMVGYYDKWYRYSRADEGRAYDLGVQLATTKKTCKDEMIIIPCMA